jgi:hypothetical protein
MIGGRGFPSSVGALRFLMTTADLKLEWRRFKHDSPGHRFRNHRSRMRKQSGGIAVASTIIGVVMIAAGGVMLVMPGPGIPVIVLGIALIAGRSCTLSGLLDRAEPPVRRTADRVIDRWHRLPMIAKVGIGIVAAAAAAGALYAMWRLWFAG